MLEWGEFSAFCGLQPAFYLQVLIAGKRRKNEVKTLSETLYIHNWNIMLRKWQKRLKHLADLCCWAYALHLCYEMHGHLQLEMQRDYWGVLNTLTICAVLFIFKWNWRKEDANFFAKLQLKWNYAKRTSNNCVFNASLYEGTRKYPTDRFINFNPMTQHFSWWYS